MYCDDTSCNRSVSRGGSSPKSGGGATEPKIVKNIWFLKKIGRQRVGKGGFGGGAIARFASPLDPLVTRSVTRSVHWVGAWFPHVSP